MEDNFSNILLFKTNIDTPGDLNVLQPAFDRHPQIQKWTLDFDDEDRVLRIISSGIDHGNIIDMVRLNGYQCEEMTD